MRLVRGIPALAVPALALATLAVATEDGPAAADAHADRIVLPAPAPTLATPVQLATIDPGAAYWQRFGHNTLIVGGDDAGVSYNFGYFDFEQPGFLARFLRGRMLYQAVALPAAHDLALYRAEARTVHLQQLNLSADQATRLDLALRQAVLPANRDYRYDYFTANCSTRVRDALDDALGGALRAQHAGRSRGATFRGHALRLADGLPWLALGIDLGLGPFADRPLSFWDEMFIPDLLRLHLRDTVAADGTPLVVSETLWFDSGTALPAQLPRPRIAWFAAIGIAMAVVLVALAARSRRSAGARRALVAIAATLHGVFGLAGLLLLLLWLATDHVAAHANENLFLLSALSLLLVPAWIRRARAGAWANAIAALVAVSALLGLLAKTLPQVFVQANGHWIALLLPLQLALWLAWRRTGADSPSTIAPPSRR